MRIRSCGLLVEEEAVLLVQLYSPVSQKLVWTPPGGGVEPGETLPQCLKREFRQETHLEVQERDLIHVHDLTTDDFHALECFFEVVRVGGNLQLGYDPELSQDEQLLRDVKWIPVEQLSGMEVVPQSLIPILQNWEGRSSFPIYS